MADAPVAPAAAPSANSMMDYANNAPAAPAEPVASAALSAPAEKVASTSSNSMLDYVDNAPASSAAAPAAAEPKAAAATTDAAAPTGGRAVDIGGGTGVTADQMRAELAKAEKERGSSLKDVPANAIKDLDEFSKSMGALSSAAMRQIKANGQDVVDAISPANDPVKRLEGAVHLANQVPGAAIGTEHAVDMGLQDFHDRYIAPALKGDWNALGQQLIHHPVNSFFDLAPETSIIGDTAKLAPALRDSALALPKAAGYMAGGVEGFNKVSDVMSSAGDAMKTMQGGISNLPWVSDKLQRMEAYNATRDALRGADASYKDFLNESVRRIDNAYRHVPKFIKPFLIEGTEGTNRLSMSMLQGSKVTENFINEVNQLSDSVTKRLIKAGLLDEGAALRARYGPSYQAMMFKTGHKIAASSLEKPEHMAALERYKVRLEKMGVKPTYWGLINHEMVKDFLEKGAHAPLTEFKPEDTTFLKDRVTAKIREHPGTQNNARLKLREGRVHSEDARDVALVRLLQGARVLALKEALDELAKHPFLTTKQQGWVKVDLEHVMGKVAEGAGLDKSQVTRFMADVQKEIYLPLRAAAQIDQLLNDFRVPAWYQWAGKTFKTLLLGPDFMWNAMQFAQNGLLYGWATVKKPQDVVNAFLALHLSHRPDIADLIPGHFLEGQVVKAAKGVEPELSPGEKMAKRAHYLLTMGPAKDLMQLNFNSATAGNNYWRMAAATKFFIDHAGPTQGPGSSLVSKMFSISAKIDDIRTGVAHPETAEKVLKEVNTWFGNYSKQRSTFGKMLESTIMFWPWFEHAWGFTMAIPRETPLKSMVANSITQAAARELQSGYEMPQYLKDLGAVPALDRNGAQQKDPNGMPMVYLKPGLTPFLTTADNVRAALGTIAPLTQDQGGYSEALVTGITWNPILRAFLWIAANANGSGSDYKDPRLFKYGPGFINDKTARQMAETGEAPNNDAVMEHPKPNPVNALGQIMMPKQWLYAARIYEHQASGGIPSDFTTPGFISAPKKMGDGSVQKALPLENYLFDTGKFAPTQTKFSAEDEASMKAAWTKKAIRSYLMKQPENK